jgi:hypothetical protein
LAAKSTPIAPDAPPLLSMAMPGFQTSPSLAIRTRDNVSVGPPGGHGTIQWIGRAR